MEEPKEIRKPRPEKKWQRGRRRTTERLSGAEMATVYQEYLGKLNHRLWPSEAHVRAVLWLKGHISYEEYRSELTLGELVGNSVIKINS